ncbi:ribosylglycohydrolase [Mycobacteroides abscessus]|uniref:Ribosylglycohydrolase n=1 Tax=Mycobacteroides saopaulense TaxID=1578165 RepID=A0ABX3BTN8_9MYCO|nr:hypothetical protein BKG68_05660 [Mycobacteroides saopaulense]CPS21880.1 ribosylglycohydrolase [Mycobacteroides abscessus]SLJ54680.1 ribosylglycohydrolase [Mycobacteroides abscessus subsp. abscessus]OHU05888.1 hypothetical protein BKG73_19805 [Mycobacteroides saopaulense]CPS73674.1 ribosylglycohydrolase [Mycobacteroides abscessus]
MWLRVNTIEHLESIDLDRARGALIGAAAGDALGAPYEFTRPGSDAEIIPKGGGAFGWEPSEWTDDTAMTVAVARGLLAANALADHGLNAVAQEFRVWLSSGPKDVGRQTKVVILHGGSTAQSMTEFARTKVDRGAGNGSLMRTAPVALRYLTDAVHCVSAAMQISDLTHPDPHAAQACAMWSYAIRHAVLLGDFNGPHQYLDEFATPSERGFWGELLRRAEHAGPTDFRNNGWVVDAVATAWWAITNAPGVHEQHLAGVLERAVRAGGDTDTTAAIAGALVGARWGAEAVPAQWKVDLHGYPGIDANGLAELADSLVEKSQVCERVSRSGT